MIAVYPSMGKSDPAVKDTGALFMEELGVVVFIPLLVSGHRLGNPHQHHSHPGSQRMGVVVLVAGMDWTICTCSRWPDRPVILCITSAIMPPGVEA